ncbi:hypothetical protein SAMN05660690_0298 [Geodermatophilus telluris]|uniref:Uncharacterized protein n=1 Tax=Geodermatophilus telluris TaxID=1190417 RepID=A0A1G6IBF3_9ACTN|nr:hypothetical protein [Geodermatophilus telluris]SDC03867.1 hypothetical protein SAMN05660690_0298 [Geodermatophilus telluris]
MISTPSICTPAGVSGPGALAVRPAWAVVVPTARPRYGVVRSLTPFDLTGTAVAAPAAPLQGTGLPTGVLGTDVFGTDVFGTDVVATGVVIVADQRTDTTHMRHTLGNHSPGRPQS